MFLIHDSNIYLMYSYVGSMYNYYNIYYLLFLLLMRFILQGSADKMVVATQIFSMEVTIHENYIYMQIKIFILFY